MSGMWRGNRWESAVPLHQTAATSERLYRHEKVITVPLAYLLYSHQINQFCLQFKNVVLSSNLLIKHIIHHQVANH